MFDLILGTQTMDELGIILDFKKKMITIDEIELPMQSINNIRLSNRKGDIVCFGGSQNKNWTDHLSEEGYSDKIEKQKNIRGISMLSLFFLMQCNYSLVDTTIKSLFV